MKKTDIGWIALAVMAIIGVVAIQSMKAELSALDENIAGLRGELELLEQEEAELEIVYMQKVDEHIAAEAEEPEPEYIGQYKITGYVPGCLHCCGNPYGIGASGIEIEPGVHCAASEEFSFGDKLVIEGIGEVTVADRGVGDGVIDIACETHEECYAITGMYDIYKGVSA